jgi:hypothetical protein
MFSSSGFVVHKLLINNNLTKTSTLGGERMMDECESGNCENNCEQQCGCRHEYYEEDMAGMMMHLAKKAKFELLKEKMKKRIETVEGKKLDKLADLVVDTMLAKYKLKMELEKKHEELGEKWEEMEEKMEEIFKEK